MEPKSFETELALIVAAAMQAGIAVWGLQEMKDLTDKERAMFMASVTRSYAEQILELVAKKYGTKNSS